MDNEEIQAETTAESTPVDGQTLETEDNGSEADQTTSEESRGDLRVPLKEERTKRQELEKQLNDPDFIYQKAQELGLTEAQAEAMADNVQQGNQFDVPKMVQYELKKEKALDKYPELKSNATFGKMVTALIPDCGGDPLKAADKFFNEIVGKAKEEAKAEGITQAKTEISEKERAQTVSSGSSVSSDQAEYERLVKDSKSNNPSTQKNAMIELLKIRNKQSGII